MAVGTDPFAHPDAQRRFRTLHNPEGLQQALEASWEKWIVLLHAAQREFVESDLSSPARVSGSAGTGKTIDALHRAAFRCIEDELGIKVRCRSTTLKIHYRTSHQIRKQAGRLRAPELSDVDGNTKERRGTNSVFNGASPVVKVAKTADAECATGGSLVQESNCRRLTSRGDRDLRPKR